MNDLVQRLTELVGGCGRVAIVGVGNTESGDDGLGIELVRRLARKINNRANLARSSSEASPARIELVEAGVQPDRCTWRLISGGFETVVFVDAVRCEGPPGTVVLLGSSGLQSMHGQDSTHRIGLGLMAKYIEHAGNTRVWLLGIKPERVAPGAGLSAPVQQTLDLLETLILKALEVKWC